MRDNKFLYKKLLLIVGLFIFFPLLSISQITRQNIERTYPVISTEKFVWFGTPNGLYNYNQLDDAFKFIPIPTKYNNPKVRQLHYYNEWLFCILDTGIAALQVRLNDWLFFDTSNGLPSNFINGIDFQGDNVWIATSSGAARFDLLIEQWEIIDKGRGLPWDNVRDINVYDEKIWMIFNNSFSEYDPKYEKWRHFGNDGDPTHRFSKTFRLGNEIWILSEMGMLRFLTSTLTTQTFFVDYLDSANLIELFTDEQTIYAISKKGLYIYEKNSGAWKEFDGNNYLGNYSIVNGFIGTSQFWFLTERNVLLWDRVNKNWEILDYASGLSATSYNQIYTNGAMTHLILPDRLDYRISKDAPWKKYKFYISGGSSSSGNFLKNLFDNEEGGYIGLWGGNKWTFEGTNIKLIQDLNKKTGPSVNSPSWEASSNYRLDAKTQLSLGNNRKITAYYNNVDYSETMYGVRYRGQDNDSVQGDLVREINWGDYRKDPGNIPFGEKANIFGTNIWLQYGDKTPRYKRSFLSLKAGGGELRTKKTFEFYQGIKTEKSIVIKDISYLKNQFFAIPGLSSGNEPEEIKVYFDDLNERNNNPNTLANQTIAGLTGDFDLLIPVEDYYFYKKATLLKLNKRINNTSNIVVIYTLSNVRYEAIIQLNRVYSTAVKNIYSLGNSQIIPYSFRLNITDTANNPAPLTDFGLAGDSPGSIEPGQIDYRNGLLIFPSPKPFPLPVYDSVPKSVYKLVVNYETENPSINLTRKNLLRNSETIRLDGVTAIAGNDYILDYTTGSLQFVREGVLNPDTRIEIEYEYYEDNDEQLYNATINFSPSDNLYIQGDWQKATTDSANLLNLHSEIRQNLLGYDIRLIPAVAYQTGVNSMTGLNFEGLLSSSWLRFQSLYQSYSKDYNNIYKPQAVIGNMSEKLSFSASADVTDNLRLTGELTNLKGFDSLQKAEPKDKIKGAGVLFHGENLPGLQLNYQNVSTNIGDTTDEKNSIHGILEYQIPKEILKPIFLKGMKIETFARFGNQTELYNNNFYKEQFFQNYYRLNTQVTEQIQGSFFYRVNDSRDITTSGTELPLARNERLMLDLSQEQWRLLQMNLRMENTAFQKFHFKSDYRDYYIRQFSQANFRLSPGQLWEKLSLLYFELSLNQSTSSSGATRGNAGSQLWTVTSQNKGSAGDFSLNRSYSVKNEIRPSTKILLFSLMEWNNSETTSGNTEINMSFWKWNEKFDIKLSYETRLIAQYKHFSQNNGTGKKINIYEPSGWLEHRWTPDLQNILYVMYKREDYAYYSIGNTGNNYELMYDIIWRKSGFIILKYVELRQTLKGAYRQQSGYSSAENYQFLSGTSLDIYPVQSIILRTRFDLGKSWDMMNPQNDLLELSLNLKLTLQM